MVCPWCGALADDPDARKCRRCGAIYAKAAALAAGLPAVTNADRTQAAPLPAAPPERTAVEVIEDSEHMLERQLRIWALPTALALSVFCHASTSGRVLQRIVFTRLLHEFGHAVTAWLCGFSATPFLWVTYIGDTRAPAMALLVGSAIAWLLFRAIQARHSGLIALSAVVALAQLVATLILSTTNAQALITFGGDAGTMVLGTALMTTFFVGENTQIKQGGLRWGFLVIGASAYVDTFATWWSARHDWDAIPFGEIEGVGLSDPSKLTDDYGWSVEPMVHRYVTLGLVCALLFTAAWIWGVVSHGRAAK